MTDHVPLTTTPLPVRLRVEDFFRLDDAGAFADYGKTELIRGEIFYMNSQHRPHARAKGQLFKALEQALSAMNSDLEVLIEATVAMPPFSAPEPDLLLTTQPDGEGPVPLASVRLIVEIADTTQQNDLGTKAGLYAENGVPEYWVVDLKARSVHQFWQPQGEAYAARRETTFARIESLTIPELAVTLA
ncbi:MAG: Uma2 family endonuclease [Sphingomonadales bacterium]|nr:Uma2 family endonuclease [Sphingomonadales bacterium]